ncbi:GAF domain-containing protein [Gymnodinialimonas ulvae]|uniref:GAF domain-containing protein n=1 Tax=Gymnodinialimonas ulvae TaxID=3126504 RepID=UPI00309C49E2
MTTTDKTRFADKLATAQTPHDAYAALYRLSDAIMPVRLWTIMAVDPTGRVAQRAFTNMPEAYPTSGIKPIEENAWSAEVLGEQKCFVANTLSDIAHVFSDHVLIGALGCGSVMNLPIVAAGRVIGTVNLLDVAHHFTPDRVATIQALLSDPARDAMETARALAKG